MLPERMSSAHRACMGVLHVGWIPQRLNTTCAPTVYVKERPKTAMFFGRVHAHPTGQPGPSCPPAASPVMQLKGFLCQRWHVWPAGVARVVHQA